MSQKILENLIDKIKPICQTPDELRSIPLYVESDKYREKIIDFISMSEERGDVLTADQLMTFVIIVSNEEEARKSEERWWQDYVKRTRYESEH